ncbi:MAG: amidohydrolase family protein [Candidatus Heimdallarchaeota archaeon]|nr:amidohydrolase family protein [Candidatus Heimdallarchaeota archaeon]MCK5048435.1 amidohydrolase family protein [Candidatus Heimdallarchaeota archaeon]
MSGALQGIKNASSIFGHSNDFDTIIWKDAVIQEVNSFANISANYSIKDIEWINANKSIILPGYVDSHTHLAFGGSREHEVEWKLQGMSYSEILSSGGGIHSTVKSTRDASLEHLTEITLSFLNTMLSTGTTTVEAKSGYGLTVED